MELPKAVEIPIPKTVKMYIAMYRIYDNWYSSIHNSTAEACIKLEGNSCSEWHIFEVEIPMRGKSEIQAGL